MSIADNNVYVDDGIGFVKLEDRFLIDPSLKVVRAARASYDKFVETMTDKDYSLVRWLISENPPHTSPFRHSMMTWCIYCPIFVMRQWMKYQVGSTWRTYELDGQEISLQTFDQLYDLDKGCSWNEISGRYTQTSSEFYAPKKLRSNPGHGNKQSSGEYKNPLSSDSYLFMSEEEILESMRLHYATSLALYKRYIANGVAKEIARMVLPNSIYSRAYWTCSLQSVLHFLDQRLRPTAQYEIRVYAEAIASCLDPFLRSLVFGGS